MRLFDAHCHLQSSDAFERSAALGIAGMAVCGTSPDDWADCIGAHKKFQGLENPPVIFPMLGIHPWFVGCRAEAVTPPESAITDRGCNWVDHFQCLEKILRDFPMVGIGECGLDFSDRFENRAEQEESFAAHLDLARELERPVAVHCVQAWGRLVEILREHSAPRVLLHAFGGAPELIPELVKLNSWFSFGSSVMNPAAKRARAAAVAVPADRLLIETDSADEPEKLIEVAGAVATLRGVSVEEIAELTFDNARKLFFQR